MKERSRARWMLITAMMAFGTIGFFVRHIPLSSGERALYRAAIAVVVLGLYLLFSRKGLSIRRVRKQLPLLILSGAAIGINWILLFEAYDYTTVSVATLSYYFAPVIVTAVCPVLFREKLTGKQILCFVMSTIGLTLITGIGTLGEGRHMVGIAFGLGAAVFYASVVLMNKYIRDVDGVERTFWQFAGATVVLLPYVLLTSGVNLHLLEPTGWASLLVVGVFHTGICYCLYFSALKELPGQKAAILSYIDPLVAVVVSVTLLQEPISGWQIAGGLLILGFTLYNEL